MSCVSVRDLIGCKFKVHGRNKEEGFDCYGLAIEVLRRNGIILPDVFYDNLDNKENTYQEIINKAQYIKIEKPQEMCIILINEKNNPTHVGVYLGSGKFIHSTHVTGVIIEPLHAWLNKVEGFYKVIN